jgi:pantothenate kinase
LAGKLIFVLQVPALRHKKTFFSDKKAKIDFQFVFLFMPSLVQTLGKNCFKVQGAVFTQQLLLCR